MLELARAYIETLGRVVSGLASLTSRHWCLKVRSGSLPSVCLVPVKRHRLGRAIGCLALRHVPSLRVERDAEIPPQRLRGKKARTCDSPQTPPPSPSPQPSVRRYTGRVAADPTRDRGGASCNLNSPAASITGVDGSAYIEGGTAENRVRSSESDGPHPSGLVRTFPGWPLPPQRGLPR